MYLDNRKKYFLDDSLRSDGLGSTLKNSISLHDLQLQLLKIANTSILSCKMHLCRHQKILHEEGFGKGKCLKNLKNDLKKTQLHLFSLQVIV